MRANINIHNMDCMEAMKDMEDNQFDLAIVDPPYGVKYARGKHGWGTCDNRPDLKDVHWDNQTPDKSYFNELLRISKNQIICGGNYFTDKIPVSKCWIVWNKIDKTQNKSVFADAELIWTSFTKVVKMYIQRTMGFISDTNDKQRIHPTQKPTELYKWILQNYAKEGDKILDTHLGSGSIAIACWDLKFDLTAYELDEEYYKAAMKRFDTHCKQGQLF